MTNLYYRWLAIASIAMLQLLPRMAFAQVDRDDIAGSNPFEVFMCPIIGIVRNYGLATVILFVIIIAIAVFFVDKGGEDKSIMSVLKSLGMVVVGIGIVLVLYFLFEEWIIDQFGTAICSSAIN